MVKAAVERKEVLGARDEFAKGKCMEVYKVENRKLKKCVYHIKKDVNEYFGRKVNQDLYGNWGKVESCSRIRDENGRLALGEDEVQRTWKDYFEDLDNINTQ